MLVYVVRLFLQRKDYEQMADVRERMNKVASASALTIIAAGAVLANPGVFMLLAAKGISQLDPTTAQFVIDWALFATVALLALGVTLLLLLLAPVFIQPRLVTARGLVERHSPTILAIVLLGLAVSLLRDGIAGLAS